MLQALDWLVVGSALLGACLFLWRHFRHGGSKSGGCGSCSAATTPQLVQLSRPSQRLPRRRRP